MSEKLFAIVGAGQAGAWVARTLRAEGFDGRIVLIGAEPHLPYERPPLSKGILSGAGTIASATLLSEENARAAAIEHWPEACVTAIDTTARSLACADGRILHYDHLFLTTGSRARRLPMTVRGTGAQRTHMLRTLDDALRLRAVLAQGGTLAVIGGGWIGLEVAATARRLGLEVVIVEAGSRLCARSVPAEVSDYLAALHRGHGVAVELDAAVRDIVAGDGSVVLTLPGRSIAVEQIVIGIGVEPDTDLAVDAGLLVLDGIVVDDRGRTSHPAISAAGDVTIHPSAFHGRHVRQESWLNAQNQAIVAARAALGIEARHADVPWLWSDQYDANIQIVGTPEAAAELLVRGAPENGAGCWLALDRDGRAIGAVAVNAPRDLRAVRKALEQGLTPDRAQWVSGAKI